jgi:single-strand DNA-binding protein
MLNQTVIVGRLIDDIKIANVDKLVYNLTLAVPRSYKNDKGEYETDFIDCQLWNGIAENTMKNVKKGDLIGIKGRLRKSSIEEKMILIAEKVTFLSSKKEEEK